MSISAIVPFHRNACVHDLLLKCQKQLTLNT
jgi:hypothetical protein